MWKSIIYKAPTVTPNVSLKHNAKTTESTEIYTKPREQWKYQNYMGTLLMGTPKSVIQPLQKIQNFAARLVLLAPRHHHKTPLLEKLHWLPISERIKYKVACMCFSAINGSSPAYLSELLHVYTPSRTLRSSSDTRMLEIQQYKRKTHGFRTFSCFGPHIWNSLPQDLRHCSTLSSFKAKLKTFLFSQYFHPN